MRKLLILALALLLPLAACAKDPAPPPAPTPEPEARSTPSPAPTPTPERRWWEEVDSALLPREPEATVSCAGVPCTLLGVLEDTRLYCGVDAEAGGYLLEREGALLYLPAPMEALPEAAPKLQYGDFDADGAQELLVLLYESPHAARLSICTWEAGWTRYALDPEIYNPLLLDALTYDYQPYTATVSCCGDTASYTLGAGETGPAGLHEDFGGLLFFRVSGSAVTAVFGVGVDVDGQTRYFANLTADVLFDGASFALQNFQLVSTGGV